MKKIAIANTPYLSALKEELKNMGYNIIYSEDIDSPVDAFIYYSNNGTESLLMVNQHLNNVFSSIQSNLQTDTDAQPYYGTLLINAKGKTVDQILQILRTRTYSPLF